MKHTLFIADIHLQTDDQHPINKAFYHFLENIAPKAEVLYIVGDLFEAWTGDDIGIEIYHNAIQKLKTLIYSGTPICLLYGNRDFLMREQFWATSGIQFLKDETEINLYGKRVVMLHGDTLCTEDTSYQKMRTVVRNPIISWIFLHLSKLKRTEIGEKMRDTSKKSSRRKSDIIMDVEQATIEKVFKRHPTCHHMVHGHTHRPGHDRFMMDGFVKDRWVLGDWQPATTILKVSEDQSFNLVKFK